MKAPSRRSLFAATALGVVALFGCDDSAADPAGQLEPDSTRTILLPDVAMPDAAPDAGPMADAAMDADDGGDAGVFADAGDDTDSGFDPICSDPPPPPPQTRISLASRCREDGGPLRIRDLRDQRCPSYQMLPTRQPGRDVVLVEAVVSGVYGDNFTIQDPEGGTYSGVGVFNRGGVSVEQLQPGTRVRISGQIFEFFTLTQLVLEDEADLEVLGQGDPPASILVSDPSRVGDDGDLVEALESVLLRFESNLVIDTAPDCPSDFGMFVISGGLRVDDEAPLDYEPGRGDVLRSVTGVLSFSFDHQKVMPRGDDDLDWVACGGPPDKCEEAACPVTEDAEESGALVITELQINPRGDDLLREYLELYNPGPQAVSLDGWWVQDCGGNRADLVGRINPGSYYVIAGNRNRNTNGGVRAAGEFDDFFLPNGFGSVLLFDGERSLVDQVRYSPEAPWPLREVGQSLELGDPADDNMDGAKWYAGRQDYGPGGQGTPGRAR